MKRMFVFALAAAGAIAAVAPVEQVAAQRRVVVRPKRVVVRPAPRVKLVVRTGHPIRRVLPTTVVVRPARRVVAIRAPLVFLPAMVWAPVTAILPPRERLVWQDAESIGHDEGWVDTNFGIDSSGQALFLDINGTARLNFAEVTFVNGQVQVLDFNESSQKSGIYKLMDFVDGRHVMTVRILAMSESDESKLTVYLGKI